MIVLKWTCFPNVKFPLLTNDKSLLVQVMANKPSPEPMLTLIYIIMSCLQATMIEQAVLS